MRSIIHTTIRHGRKKNIVRVLVVDMDIQNSLSFYYLDNVEVIEEKNIAFALHSEKFKENILGSNYKGVDIIPSSFSLVDLRSVPAGKLSGRFDAFMDDRKKPLKKNEIVVHLYSPSKQFLRKSASSRNI